MTVMSEQIARATEGFVRWSNFVPLNAHKSQAQRVLRRFIVKKLER